MNTKKHHADLLSQIIKKSGTPTQHTFLDAYLGNSHPRYPINVPQLRLIAKNWIKHHEDLTLTEFQTLLTSLIKAPSSTEKTMAGLLLDYANEELLKLNPKVFDQWLNHLTGWAEVDSLCYGHFHADLMLENWATWKTAIAQLNQNKNINKRRASLVLLCKPLTQSPDERLELLAFKMVDHLTHEKEILITKAISWLLRSMVKLHSEELMTFMKKNKTTLPAIALRETCAKLKTG